MRFVLLLWVLKLLELRRIPAKMTLEHLSVLMSDRTAVPKLCCESYKERRNGEVCCVSVVLKITRKFLKLYYYAL